MAQVAVTAMTLEQIQNKAPSVFAVSPSNKTSSRYAFVPTTQVITDLGQEGWVPVSAREANVRDETKEGYQKHIIRFRHPDLSFNKLINVGDIVPEIVLTNSHDAKAAFHLHAGIFRLVCRNGMIVADATIAKVCIKHVGYASADAHKAGQTLFQEIPKLTANVESMQAMRLQDTEATILANSAAMVRWPVDDTHVLPFDPALLLTCHRTADKELTLWNAFNRIQENLLQGGIRYRTVENKKQRTRKVNGINEDIRINKALWMLAENMLKLKQSSVH